MNIGKRITELREREGITTNRLANLCGLSQSFVRSVELGEKGITVDNLALICETLQISLRDFFDVPEVTGKAVSDNESLREVINRLSSPQKKALEAFLQTI